MQTRAVARVLILNERGELLLCQSRNGKAWVPPGGTIDPGESLVTAAVREAMEEAGLAVTIGPLVYVQEFRPAGRDEQVIEVAFRALPLTVHPSEQVQATQLVESAGTPARPWASWTIQDVDGPRRRVAWFSKEQIMAASLPVYPECLRGRVWEMIGLNDDRYLGLVQGG